MNPCRKLLEVLDHYNITDSNTLVSILNTYSSYKNRMNSLKNNIRNQILFLKTDSKFNNKDVSDRIKIEEFIDILDNLIREL